MERPLAVLAPPTRHFIGDDIVALGTLAAHVAAVLGWLGSVIVEVVGCAFLAPQAAA